MNLAGISKVNIFNNAYKANWVGNNVVCLCSTIQCKTLVALKGKDCPRLAFRGMTHYTLTPPMLMFSWCFKHFLISVMDACPHYNVDKHPLQFFWNRFQYSHTMSSNGTNGLLEVNSIFSSLLPCQTLKLPNNKLMPIMFQDINGLMPMIQIFPSFQIGYWLPNCPFNNACTTCIFF